MQEVVARTTVRGRTNWSLWRLSAAALTPLRARQDLTVPGRGRRSSASGPCPGLGRGGLAALAYVHREVARPGTLRVAGDEGSSTSCWIRSSRPRQAVRRKRRRAPSTLSRCNRREDLHAHRATRRDLPLRRKASRQRPPAGRGVRRARRAQCGPGLRAARGWRARDRRAPARRSTRPVALGGQLANPLDKSPKRLRKVPSSRGGYAARGAIDALEAELPPLKRFILPGGSRSGAMLTSRARSVGAPSAR